jgi:hypothetical protein
MALIDQAQYALIGLAKQRIPGVGGRAVDLAEVLYRRSLNGLGTPGSRAQVNTDKDPLAAMRNRSDPLMNFNWWADMPVLDSQFRLGWEFVEEATLPFIEFEQISNYRAGKNYHYAHHFSLGSLNLKFYEDSRGTATDYLTRWQSLIHNKESGLYYFPSDYKKTITVWVLDVAKLTVMCLDYTGCWPQRLETLQFGSASSERVVSGAEFSVDEVNLKVFKFSPSEIPSVVQAVGKDYPPRLSALPDVFPSRFVNFTF